MASRPLTEAQLWDEINAAAARMDPPQARLWEAVKIMPARWSHHRHGPFWAVATMGESVVWYDDIENGFVVSSSTRHGHIDNYSSGERSLEAAIQDLLNRL